MKKRAWSRMSKTLSFRAARGASRSRELSPMRVPAVSERTSRADRVGRYEGRVPEGLGHRVRAGLGQFRQGIQRRARQVPRPRTGIGAARGSSGSFCNRQFSARVSHSLAVFWSPSCHAAIPRKKPSNAFSPRCFSIEVSSAVARLEPVTVAIIGHAQGVPASPSSRGPGRLPCRQGPAPAPDCEPRGRGLSASTRRGC